jgi:predicted MFS family arabinose efflux permease
MTGVLLDRFSQSALTAAVVIQGVGMLGLYAAGAHQATAVVFLVLMGGALGPVFMTIQNAVLQCAPGRTDIAFAAGAALGGLILSLADVRSAFLAGGLLTVVACTVLLVSGCMRRLAVR